MIAGYEGDVSAPGGIETALAIAPYADNVAVLPGGVSMNPLN